MPWRDAEPGKILHELRTGRDGPDRRAAVRRPTTAPSIRRRSGSSSSARPTTGPATTPWSTGSGRTRWPRWPGSTTTAISTATASSSTSAAAPSGLVNQGWKDSADAIRDRGRPPRRAADRPGRGPGLRLRRQAADRPAGRASVATPTWPTAWSARPPPSRRRFDEAFWMADGGLRDGPRRDKRPWTPSAPNAGHCAVERDRRRRPRGRPSPSSLASRRVLGLGHPDVRRGRAGYNPLGYHTGTVWPHDNALSPRPAQALRLRRRGGALQRGSARGRPALPGFPPAGAVLRLRPDRDRRRRSPIRSPARRRPGPRRRPDVHQDDARAQRDASQASSTLDRRTCPTGWPRSS